jgi:hypothetical protein
MRKKSIKSKDFLLQTFKILSGALEAAYKGGMVATSIVHEWHD